MATASGCSASIRPSSPSRCSSAAREPAELARAARIGEAFGYDEINLNVGCPSDRVQYGRFGACLMREPELVGDCVAAMKAAVAVPVTVKCRIGVDDQDPEAALDALADAVVAAGARRAHRPCPQGLAAGPVAEGEPRHPAARLRPRLPAEARACRDLPDRHQWRHRARWTRRGRICAHVDGVMLGRAAYHEPRAAAGRSIPQLFGEAAAAADAFEAVERLRALHSRASLAEGAARLHGRDAPHAGPLPAGRAPRALGAAHLATEAVKPGAGLDCCARRWPLVGRERGPEAACSGLRARSSISTWDRQMAWSRLTSIALPFAPGLPPLIASAQGSAAPLAPAAKAPRAAQSASGAVPCSMIVLAELAFLVVGLLAAGAVTGLLAGVFGVGGGASSCPCCTSSSGCRAIPEEVRMPLAVGTSLAIIIPTSIRSFLAHRRRERLTSPF